jgi:hypothetical protein
VLVLQVGLQRLSAMLACVMSGLANPGVLAESGYISGGPSFVSDGGAFSSVVVLIGTIFWLLTRASR